MALEKYTRTACAGGEQAPLQRYPQTTLAQADLVLTTLGRKLKMSGYIRVDGTKLVDTEGKEVILRGAGLGGWMT